ncbi:hypothetical protein SAMN06295987_101792 [Novosphingobium mathurense]|uniref:Transcriptional regulator, AlpA family n=1 Tax=Novosphingobium mathurense TaxID=428990 RepID=A0A1U6GXR8_9SPHN|nr:hypothetical protein SAMN06295987_101792 [Novosphingobium mathurense]
METIDKPWAGLPATGPLLRPKAAAEYLGCSVSAYYASAARGELPAFIKMGRGHFGSVAVPRPWLDAVIAARVNGGAI